MWFNCDSLVFFQRWGLISSTLPSSHYREIILSIDIFHHLWFLGSAFSRRVSINAWEKDFTPRIRGRVSISVTGLSGNTGPNIYDVFRVSGHYDFSIVVVSGTMNCGSCRLQISSLWLLKCCVLWPQRSMAHQVTNSLSVTSQMLWCMPQ